MSGELWDIASGEKGLDGTPPRQPLRVRHGKQVVPDYRA